MHALHMAARNPGFSLLAVLTLGIGIAANTTIEEVNAGKLGPEKLALRATDDSLDIELRTSTPFLLQLLSHRVFCAVPRRSIETYVAAWAEPGRIMANGAFILKEHRPNDRIVLASNREYYEAEIVDPHNWTYPGG